MGSLARDFEHGILDTAYKFAVFVLILTCCALVTPITSFLVEHDSHIDNKIRSGLLETCNDLATIRLEQQQQNIMSTSHHVTLEIASPEGQTKAPTFTLNNYHNNSTPPPKSTKNHGAKELIS